MAKMMKTLQVCQASSLEPLFQDDNAKLCLTHEIFHQSEGADGSPLSSEIQYNRNIYRIDYHQGISDLLKDQYKLVAPSVSIGPTGEAVTVEEFANALRYSLVKVSFTINHRVVYGEVDWHRFVGDLHSVKILTKHG